MSDAFTDVAKMKKIKEDIKAHEGKMVELTLENGRKREKNKQGRLIEVYSSLFIVEYNDRPQDDGSLENSYVESYTYSDILTEKTLIRYLDDDNENTSDEKEENSEQDSQEMSLETQE
ncbi:Veg family protein [Streptococcus sp. CSL7508-lung]|uniref:Veg family protein n=1 Tax=Streptococcus zalophi TaxID=640031 RepID=A0A934PAC5_9STRE|nr:Veg family protein [Streptococcus zalophi]